MLQVLELAALILTAIAMGLTLAHALELPGKLRLERQEYLAVQRIYYPGFTIGGASEPLAIIALAVLLLVTPARGATFWLIAAALVAAVTTHLIYWFVTAPVNRVWLTAEKLSPGAKRFFGDTEHESRTENWMVLRSRWERSHLYRATAAASAFVLLATALITRG